MGASRSSRPPRRRRLAQVTEDAPLIPSTPRRRLTSQHLREVTPLTATQRQFVTAYHTEVDAMIVDGPPGTGKTYLSLYHMLHDVLTSKRERRLILLRSAVPSRSMGFLPGTEEDKLRSYSAPYRAMCAHLFQQPEAFDHLVAQHTLEFQSTSYLRGLTWDDALILVDECQNMAPQELHTILTRVGQRSRIVFCGDAGQMDLTSSRDTSGWLAFADRLRTLPMVAQVSYTAEDIVRSSLVKAYLLACLAGPSPREKA